ncbi:hypothetical protein BN946_scf184911.g126 [Trametes cinnabarina]|uniref:Uncharacterized protein n=1 Tax=Pycnoporus cinnabarinus TaxID=5643 RepID=A0A060SBC5_PYCCI|nr:hypothetical protein BN946_scf184911.g126 [Trametes cinnabarina]
MPTEYTAEDLANPDEAAYVENALVVDDAHISAAELKRDQADEDFTASQSQASTEPDSQAWEELFPSSQGSQFHFSQAQSQDDCSFSDDGMDENARSATVVMDNAEDDGDEPSSQRPAHDTKGGLAGGKLNGETLWNIAIVWKDWKVENGFKYTMNMTNIIWVIRVLLKLTTLDAEKAMAFVRRHYTSKKGLLRSELLDHPTQRAYAAVEAAALEEWDDLP